MAVHHLDLLGGSELPGPAAESLTLGRRTVEAVLGGSLPADWDDDACLLLGSGRRQPTEAERAAAGPVLERLPVLG